MSKSAGASTACAVAHHACTAPTCTRRRQFTVWCCSEHLRAGLELCFGWGPVLRPARKRKGLSPGLLHHCTRVPSEPGGLPFPCPGPASYRQPSPKAHSIHHAHAVCLAL